MEASTILNCDTNDEMTRRLKGFDEARLTSNLIRSFYFFVQGDKSKSTINSFVLSMMWRMTEFLAMLTRMQEV